VLHHLDRIRRSQGRLLDAAGLGRSETPSDVIAAWDGVRLRAYGGDGGAVLVVPAPIKRPYIWDLAPQASAIRRLLEAGTSVFLTDWTRPDPQDDGRGLEEHADGLLLLCVDAIAAATGRREVVLAGHSLGGTLAAIFAARRPDRVRGLLLVEAPLRFGPHAGAFAPLVAAAPHARAVTAGQGSVPGSFLNVASGLAAPLTFQGERYADLFASLAHPPSLALHLRVQRWTLDESPMPAALFEDVVERLYRGDELMRGELEIAGERVSPSRVTAPLLTVVNPMSRVIPPASVLPFHDAAASARKRVLRYRGDRGVALQHVGALVGPSAHCELWPEIVAWTAELA
jgi:polyhydroxyalkanoate synthase